MGGPHFALAWCCEWRVRGSPGCYVLLENKGSGVKGQKVSSSGEKRNKLSQERRSVSIVAQATVEASALHRAARDWPAEVLRLTSWGRNWMADPDLLPRIGTPLGVFHQEIFNFNY
jgi:hypothetical protein